MKKIKTIEDKIKKFLKNNEIKWLSISNDKILENNIINEFIMKA